jgi:hypothetical protein
MANRLVNDKDNATVFPVAEALFGNLSLSSNFGEMRGAGDLWLAAGNPLGANAADTTDDILYGIALDAAALIEAGQGLEIFAQGNTGATANNKRIKAFLNPTMTGQTVSAGGIITGGHVTAGTPIVDTGTWTSADNAVGWQITMMLMKYGALGSNTQVAQGSPITGSTHLGIQAAQFLTLNEAAIINIVITGASYTTGAAGDVLLNMFGVSGMNNP